MSKNNPTKPMSKTYCPHLTRTLAERMFEVSMEHGESLSMDTAVRVADDFCADLPAVALTPYQIAAARAVANFRSMADYVLNAFESDDPRPDEDSWDEAKRFIEEIDSADLTDETVISAKHGNYKLQVTFGDPDIAVDEGVAYVSGHDADAAYETAVQLVKLTQSDGAVELFRNGRSIRLFTTKESAEEAAAPPGIVEKWKGPDRITFGKHKGKTLNEILQQAPQYLLWLAENEVLLLSDELVAAAEERCDSAPHYADPPPSLQKNTTDGERHISMGTPYDPSEDEDPRWAVNG